MINRIIFIGVATLLLASCGPKEFTPCECQEVIGGKNSSAEGIKYCNEKIASDSKFAEAITKCAAEALGHDTSKSDISSSSELKAEKGAYTINPAKSSVKWTGRKVAGAHTGTVAVKSGSFSLEENGTVTGGMVTLDMTGITVTDIKDEESNADLVGHLKADDFFGVAAHPEAMYKINSAELIPGGNGTNYNVEGELTIKGITKPVQSILVITKTKGKNVLAASSLTFDRTEFGIKYKSGKFFDSLGDNMIKDEVTLQVTLVANKN